uniref:Suppressor APC domain containing 2 n=1 Tax=Athene cunicularia TaxID=194338 RepID=A0A663NDI4_ATHCN
MNRSLHQSLCSPGMFSCHLCDCQWQCSAEGQQEKNVEQESPCAPGLQPLPALQQLWVYHNLAEEPALLLQEGALGSGALGTPVTALQAPKGLCMLIFELKDWQRHSAESYAMLCSEVPQGGRWSRGLGEQDCRFFPRFHTRGLTRHWWGAGDISVCFVLQLKHMKELEQEKDFLLQGLELVERTREWYHQHIQFMQERQRLLGKNKTTAEFLPEGGQSHLGRLVPKLQEVNRCLGDLLSTATLSRLVPVASPASAGSQQAINMLKEQNRLLTKEVTDKSERITQLEQEKSALIKQLFEARARNNNETSQLDSTFI